MFSPHDETNQIVRAAHISMCHDFPIFCDSARGIFDAVM